MGRSEGGIRNAECGKKMMGRLGERERGERSSAEGLLTKMNIEHRTSNSPEASKHLSASGGSNVEFRKDEVQIRLGHLSRASRSND